MSNYTPYHVHTKLSNGITNIDSISNFQEYIDLAQKYGMKAFAFSEHGCVLEWVHKKNAIEKAGMKYIHAEEFYLTEEINPDELVRDNYHCVLIARNWEGVKELNKLSSKSFYRDGHFYYNPRITFEELENTTDNIIVTSACFLKGSNVSTINGVKKIENILHNDYVKNMYGDWEKVNYPTQIYYNDIGYEFSISNTKEIIKCTKDHKFLVASANNNTPRWIKAQDIASPKSLNSKEYMLFPIKTQYSQLKILKKDLWKNSYISPSRKLKTIINDIVITPEFMRLIGLFIGDGSISLSSNPRITFTLNYYEYNNHYKCIFNEIEKQIGLRFSKTIRSNNNRVDISTSSVDFINLFYWLFGDTKAKTKHIPNVLKHISEEYDMELFYGYLLSDGSVKKGIKDGYNYGRFTGVTISDQLKNDLMDLFDSLNIHYSVREVQEHIDKNGVHHNKAYYIESNTKEYLKINKLNLVSHSDIVTLVSNIQNGHKHYFIKSPSCMYKKKYIKSIKKIHINDIVYCLNNNSHSFICENVVAHNCVGGVLCKGADKAKQRYLKFLIKNKHRCFLEIQHHNDSLQSKYNQVLYTISQRFDIPLIAGTDSHAAYQEQLEGRLIEQKSHEVYFSGEDSWDLVFKSYDELVQAYKKQNALPENVYLQAIKNTNVMADMIEEFELDYTKKYPVLYDNSLQVLKQKISEGIKRRGIDKLPNYQKYKDRIVYELKTYIHNGAIDFLLLEEDYKTAMKEKGINFGYSRGSVSGSVIAYILGITEVDSVKYNLNFERFMNTERVSLADVDTDWYATDRDRVRDYLFAKKNLYCCNIVTFNTIALKGAIKDVGRALGYPPSETQAISNSVTQNEDKKDVVPDVVKKKYSNLFHYVDMVMGTITSLGRHAAGLVISPIDIEETFGTLRIETDERPVSQINMKEIDSLNYVKLDILGLDCVGLIDGACKLAGIPFLTPDNTDYNDKKVWDSIAEDTTMIFQFESGFASDYLKQILRPQVIAKVKEQNPNFSYIDLMSMANGAIRPAGASYRNELSQGIYRDNGNKALNDFLSPTLGFLVYQEQIIEFLHKFCGFTMGEADIVRRHFSKKTGTEKDIPVIKDGGYLSDNGHYIKGFIQTMKDDYGVEKEEAEKIIKNFLKVIIDASDYLFSLNHAQPYSFLGYAVGYLRYYYPLETYTTALNVYKNKKEKDKENKLVAITRYINNHNVEIRPIKFGKSGAKYTLDKTNGVIYKGIESIKDCNAKIADELLEVATRGHKDFFDLLQDIKDNTSVGVSKLKILTTLNFFSDYGKNDYLLKLIDLFYGLKIKSKTILPLMFECKVLSKDKIDTYKKWGITGEGMVKKYAGKETAKQFREIDNQGLIKDMCNNIPNKSLSTVLQIKAEKDYLGYVEYTNPNMSENYYIVLDYKTYKDETKPYFTVRNLKTGEETKTRIKQSKIYKESPFGEYSILLIQGFTWDYRKKYIEGEWRTTDDLEPILEQYQVMKG